MGAFKKGLNVPEQPTVPPMPPRLAEVDRLYLEKCQEVNRLEELNRNLWRSLDKYRDAITDLKQQLKDKEELLEESNKLLKALAAELHKESED